MSSVKPFSCTVATRKAKSCADVCLLLRVPLLLGRGVLGAMDTEQHPNRCALQLFLHNYGMAACHSFLAARVQWWVYIWRMHKVLNALCYVYG